MGIVNILEEFPEELQGKLLKFYEAIRQELLQGATKDDIADLRTAIRELTEAQKNTDRRIDRLAAAQEKSEKRLDRVEKSILELTEAQKKTDQRIDRLTVAQEKSEKRLDRVEKSILELTEAQKKSERRLDRVEKSILELTEAQKNTDKRIDQLVRAQDRNTREISRLTGEMRVVKKELGGISHSVGFDLENQSYKHLPELLKQDFRIEVEGRLKREFIENENGVQEEVNIIGTAHRNGELLTILGEAKTNLARKHINDFLKMVKRLNRIVTGTPFLIAVTHMTTPDVEKYANDKGIQVYYSYQF